MNKPKKAMKKINEDQWFLIIIGIAVFVWENRKTIKKLIQEL